MGKAARGASVGRRSVANLLLDRRLHGRYDHAGQLQQVQQPLVSRRAHCCHEYGLTSIFSGMVVFSILGFMANQLDTSVADVATKGPGLVFITYPQAVVMFSASPVWSAIFFLMLTVLALSTMFPTTENISHRSVPGDSATAQRWVTVATCVTLFVGGLPLTTSGGMYILQIMDRYAVGNALLALGLVEILVIGWRYGADRLLDNIEAMTDNRPWHGWTYVWKYVTPGLLIFAIGFTVIASEPLKYGDYTFSTGWTVAGNMCTLFTVMPILVFIVCRLPSAYMASTSEAKGISKLAQVIIRETAPGNDWQAAQDKVTDDDSTENCRNVAI